jgi:hypothetical protein
MPRSIEEGEVASLSVCSGDPDGGRAAKRSVVYLPCPNGVTAIKISTKAPHLKQLWTDNDGAAGAPIIADGLVWTIGGDSAVHGLNPANGKEVVSIPFGRFANHFTTPSVGDGLLLLPGTDQVFAFGVRPGGRRDPPRGEAHLRASYDRARPNPTRGARSRCPKQRLPPTP